MSNWNRGALFLGRRAGSAISPSTSRAIGRRPEARNLGTQRRCIGIVDMGTRARNVPKLMSRTADMYDRWRLSTRASSNSEVAPSSCAIPV